MTIETIELARNLDLGSNVYATWLHYKDIDKAGIIEEHLTPDGKQCYGTVMFDIPGIRESGYKRAVWQVESFDPLTLSPSILCTTCKHHGYIKQGRWVPA